MEQRARVGSLTGVSRRLSRRAALGLGLVAVGSAAAGTATGWFGRWPGSANGPRAGTTTEVEALYLDFAVFAVLLDASEAVVLGRVMASSERTDSVAGVGRWTAQMISLEVQEVLKDTTRSIAGVLEFPHGVRAEWDPGGTATGRTTVHTARAINTGASVVAFLSRSTSPDGSRLWSLTGEPGVAEVHGDRLVFIASDRYVHGLADSGIKLAPGGGDAPFAVTLQELREAAPRSLDPAVVDPPRDTVPPPPRPPAGPKPTAAAGP